MSNVLPPIHRYFIDPETLEHIEIPYGFRVVRIANHPETGELVVLPRNDVNATIRLSIDDNVFGGHFESDSVHEVEVALRSRLIMIVEPVDQTLRLQKTG